MVMTPDNKKRRDNEVVDGNLRPAGYEQISSLSAATSLTIPAAARMALISPQTQDVRWRDDGTDPTAAIGMPITAGDSFWYTGDLTTFRVIETTPSAKLNVAYYA